MTSYDIHQHLWPEPLIRTLETRRERPRLRNAVLELVDGDWPVDVRDYELDRRLAALDRDEIDVAVVSCPPTLGLDEALLTAYHDGIREVVAASGGRVEAFASDAALDGFVGACISAERLARLDALAPLLDELERGDGVLFVHPGPAATPDGAPPWWAAVVGYTAQMQAAFAAWMARPPGTWPELRVVFAILAGGAPFQLERYASRGVDSRSLLDPNVYLDTASYADRALELTLAAYGVNQLLYGSDAPVIDPEPTLRSIRGFGDAVADAVCRDNPNRLFA